MRIAVVGPSRFGIGEPYAGGLEAHTATLAVQLHADGHDVTVFAGPLGAPHRLPVEVVPIIRRPLDRARRLDISNPAWFARHEDDCYGEVAEALSHADRFDVIHNNSLHRRLVDDDPATTPIIHTLHCPPFDRLATAHRRLQERAADRFVIAVSRGLAMTWGTTATGVVHNGVDLDRWRPGPRSASSRSGSCAWAGRIIGDKAPHLAIDAALAAGRRIVLAGPVHDQDYFDGEIRPRLASSSVSWVGPCDGATLRQMYDEADVGIVTPVWNEPFGLVVAEMLACGLPVAAFDTGATREFTDPSVAVLVAPGDVLALAAAVRAADTIDRARCRQWAQQELSIATMTNAYVELYRTAVVASAGRLREGHGLRNSATP